MKTALEQSIKEKIKVLAKERKATFAELWRNLILERFLARLACSSYRERFILKGGNLLAKYIDLGRETQDLDFLVQRVSNTENSLRRAIQNICAIDAHDRFSFEAKNVHMLDHPQLAYRGAEVKLLAKFGATKTVVRMDLGFGDRMEPIEFPIDLSATSQGPLFERTISLQCYPKEGIFAEKLETVIFRGEGNTRMKDFHDLYGLVRSNVLDCDLTKNAIQLVFQHRKTSLEDLPIVFNKTSFEKLEANWAAYLRKTRAKEDRLLLPLRIEEVVSIVNHWLNKNAIVAKK